MIPGIVAGAMRPPGADVPYLFYATAAAYTSGQLWVNETPAPADGSASAAYDYYLGTSSSSEGQDPSINAGPPVGWVFTSGNLMTLAHTTVATVPTFLRDMHMAGSQFSILVYGRWNGSVNSNICPVFDSGTSDQGGGDVSRGVVFADFGDSVQTNGRLRFRVKRDSGGASALAVESDSALPSNTDMVFGVSFDGTGTTPSFLYLNGAQMSVGGSSTFNGLLSSPGTSQTTNRPRLMARGDGAFTCNTVRLYGLALTSTLLTMAQMDAVSASLTGA